MLEQWEIPTVESNSIESSRGGGVGLPVRFLRPAVRFLRTLSKIPSKIAKFHLQIVENRA